MYIFNVLVVIEFNKRKLKGVSARRFKKNP